MYSNLWKHFVSCVVQSCYKHKETQQWTEDHGWRRGENILEDFQNQERVIKEFSANHVAPKCLPQPLTFWPFTFLIQSNLFFRIHSITSNVTPIFNLLLFFLAFFRLIIFLSLLSQLLLPSAPLPPLPLHLPPPSLHLLLTFHPSPHLSASHSPGSSCHGVVLLAERGHRRHTDGCTDGQQAVQGGQAHLLHTHTQTHTHIEPYCATLTHSLPACLPAFLGQFYRDTNTNTQIHSSAHINPCHAFKHLYIHIFVHVFAVCTLCHQLYLYT